MCLSAFCVLFYPVFFVKYFRLHLCLKGAVYITFILFVSALQRQLDLFQCLEDVSALYMGPGSSLVQKSLRILELS